MDIMEAPSQSAAGRVGQDAGGGDDLLTVGWAAPAAVGAAERDVVLEQVQVIADLGLWLERARRERRQALRERDAALDAAAECRALADQTAAGNRLLRERVARQHQTIESLRAQIQAERGRAVACEAEGDGVPAGVSPWVGRWLPWSRGLL